MYELIYSDKALKQIQSLEKEIQVRIINSLERCKIRPIAHVKKLVGNPYFRLRVGEYRVIIDIKNNELVILVIEIGHRKSIYQ